MYREREDFNVCVGTYVNVCVDLPTYVFIFPCFCVFRHVPFFYVSTCLWT